MISMHYVPRCPRRFEPDAVSLEADQGPLRHGVPLHSTFRYVAWQVYCCLFMSFFSTCLFLALIIMRKCIEGVLFPFHQAFSIFV